MVRPADRVAGGAPPAAAPCDPPAAARTRSARWAMSAAPSVMMQQAADLGIKIDHVVHATGSGTQAGLIAGLRRRAKRRARARHHRRPAARQSRNATSPTARRDVGASRPVRAPSAEAIGANDDRYFGETTTACRRRNEEAVDLLAAPKPLLLDPVYSGKAMAG